MPLRGPEIPACPSLQGIGRYAFLRFVLTAGNGKGKPGVATGRFRAQEGGIRNLRFTVRVSRHHYGVSGIFFVLRMNNINTKNAEACFNCMRVDMAQPGPFPLSVLWHCGRRFALCWGVAGRGALYGRRRSRAIVQPDAAGAGVPPGSLPNCSAPLPPGRGGRVAAWA